MIQFSNNDGSTGRTQRLIKTYLRMSPRVQGVISSMHDNKGCLTVVVNKMLPDLSERIKAAWDEECEWSFEIQHDGEVVYSTMESDREWL